MMKKIEKLTPPLGMIGVIVYLVYAILGKALWPEYNPITTDISSLTAIGAPNREMLSVLIYIYGVLMILFITGLLIKSFRKYQWGLKVGYITMIIMQFISLFGFSLFPLSGEEIDLKFQDIMHIIITVVVILATIIIGYILAFGYLKQEKKQGLGKFILVMAIIITIAGIANPVCMIMEFNILGLTERIVVYSLHLMIFVISAYYTFAKQEKID
jgi:hypothetical protein